MKYSNFYPTTDKTIRIALKENLEASLKVYAGEKRIIEELGISHGAARIDIAVVNGIIHGYELKSDLDTLTRLPEQMKIYNTVMDQMTLVVGKNHLYEALKIVPEWWGITVAKQIDRSNVITFYNIREAEQNPSQNSAAVAALLWREEALSILEERGQARGVRSKSRWEIYGRMTKVMDEPTLYQKVRQYLCARTNWRSDLQCMPSGD